MANRFTNEIKCRFNGAAVVRPRREARLGGDAILGAGLQRGRGRETAESARRLRHPGRLGRLQRGRGRETAESAAIVPLPASAHVASTGPRS